MKRKDLMAENRELKVKIALLRLSLHTSEKVVDTLKLQMNTLREEIKRLSE